mgnify:CR=1 FL=1
MLSDLLSGSKLQRYPANLWRHAEQRPLSVKQPRQTHTDFGCFIPSQLRLEVLICHLERIEKKWLEELTQHIYTVKTLCSYLGISRATLYRLIQKGQLEPLHIGSSTRFTENEVNSFISSQQKQSRIKEVGF